MDLQEILSLEGIIIRHIPKTSISLWKYNERNVKRWENNRNCKIVEENGTKFIKETKHNTLNGYCVTICKNQDSTVRFSKSHDGFGKTIEEAFKDYLFKNNQIIT